MKKIIITLLLNLCLNVYAQEDVTSKQSLNKMLKQINSIEFTGENYERTVGFVGKVRYIEVYWGKSIQEERIVYTQFLIDTETDMTAIGHTIITDLDGRNPRGTHNRTLTYKKR